MYCFKCMSHLCSCGNGRRKVQPFAATLTDYPAKIASPKDVAGLILWFRADLGTSLTGLTVERWEDQSGTGVANKHLEAFGTPTLIPGDPDYNQKPSIRFNGTTDYFSQAGAWSQAQPYTLFIVGDAHPQDDFATFIGTETNITAGGVLFYSEADYEASWRSLVGFADDYLWAEGEEVLTTSPHVYCFTCNGASSSLHIDGFQNALITDNIGDNGLSQFSIGTSPAYGGGMLPGRVAEIIAFSGALTEARRGSVMRYLRERYTTPVMSEGTGYQRSGAAPPIVTAINPSSGLTTGGFTVDITVNDSTGCTSATVNGVALTGFTVINSTTVQGTTATGMGTGLGDVTVTNATGVGTLTNGFTGIAWTPAYASVGCRAWYRPDLGATLNGGGTQVIALADQSGSGDAARNLVSTGGAVGVPYTAANALFNNMPTINGNSSETLVSSTGVNWTTHPFATPGAVCIIGKCSANTMAFLSTLNVGGSSQSHNLLWAENSFVPPHFEQYNGATTGRSTSVSAISNAAMVMITDDGGGGASAAKIYFNNLSGFEHSRTTNFNVRSSGLIVEGANLSIFLESHGIIRASTSVVIAEVIFFNGVPTAGDMTNLRTYLNNRYNLGIA